MRGKQVMLDSDLAILYGYEVKRLNEQVKNNINRFPEDFMFQMTKEEVKDLRSKFSTANINPKSRSLPHVFTEQGIYMLATVLNGEIAEKQSIFIMRAFREMRHFIMNNERMFERINSIELKQLEYQKESEEKFNKIFDYIADHKEDNQKIFFDGQIYDAFSLLTDIVGQAKREIVLIDGYIDVITLNILAKKNAGVDVFAYTLPSARISSQDINNFNAQYPTLTIKKTIAFHDRFLIIDGVEGYHIGASLKDAGKKCFGVNKIEGTDVVKDIMKKAQQTGT
ncbi:ORF6N domain-containing protein [Butyrivibrio sp. AC2005]|uniref:ORF6N domain-containing protein n=1 Tax=Butyrivibrio sp. AC2005 TaxID=1280672 RepID=UPI002E8E1546|nr:ORF6N domain-containing protein [Butyrivibrio sp. AC2005]